METKPSLISDKNNFQSSKYTSPFLFLLYCSRKLSKSFLLPAPRTLDPAPIFFVTSSKNLKPSLLVRKMIAVQRHEIFP